MLSHATRLVHALREEGCEHPALANLRASLLFCIDAISPDGRSQQRLLPASSIFTTHSMSFKKHRSFETQLNARDVDGILMT